MSETHDAGFSMQQLDEILHLLTGVASVELKVTVAEDARQSALESLDIDPLDAGLRQVTFFDTPGLALNRQGIIVRGRRIQGRPGDMVVKLRPVVPENVPEPMRKSRNLGLELDVMPGGFTCSASIKARLSNDKLREAFSAVRSVQSVLSREQRDLLASLTGPELELDEIRPLGTVNVLRLGFSPAGYERRLVAELWSYPDGSRLLELSTKCAPSEAFEIAAMTRVYLAGCGIDLLAEQATKTKRAMELFASEISVSNV